MLGRRPSISTPSDRRKLYGIVLLVAAIVVVGTLLIARFTAMDLARDMQSWRSELNLIAESRADAVNQWVGNHFKELRALADNPSLQLYLTELDVDESGKTPALEPAQKSYLRNLLVFTAERSGFSQPNRTKTIRANVQQENEGGLAIINNDNHIIVSTQVSPETQRVMLEQAKKTEAGRESLIDFSKNANGNLTVGFVVPVFSIQGERNAASQIGKAIGIKPVDGSLFDILKHPGTTQNTLEAILVRANGDRLDFLSPLQDGTGALERQGVIDPTVSAEAYLAQNAGSFIGDLRDYRDRFVLATARAVAGTPWSLIVKIDRQEALSESSERRAGLVLVFFLLILVTALIIIAVWWRAHSLRSLMMSTHYRDLAAQALAQEHLLRLVADHQPEAICIIDADGIYRFANQQTADLALMSLPHVVGKPVSDVRGTARARQISVQCEKAMQRKQIIFDVQHMGEDHGNRVIRSAYVPLDHIPVATLKNPTPGVLIVEQDISEVVQERERRLSTQNQLVQTLVKLVDKRDPFAANHSMLVSHVAGAVALEMNMDNITAETARTAGNLMNIGKIVVPTELLTKTASLTPKEKRIVSDSLHMAAELLKDIHFDGPVAETLQQWQEHWDGSGPLALKGEAIVLPARIIAVANAFVGMISPRSWRKAIPIEEAAKTLMEQANAAFDQRVVAALVNYVENHSGRSWLDQVLENKKK